MAYTLNPLEARQVALDAAGQAAIGAGTATYSSSDKRVFTVGPGSANYRVTLTAIKGGEGMTAQLQATFAGSTLAVCDVSVAAVPPTTATFV